MSRMSRRRKKNETSFLPFHHPSSFIHSSSSFNRDPFVYKQTKENSISKMTKNRSIILFLSLLKPLFVFSFFTSLQNGVLIGTGLKMSSSNSSNSYSVFSKKADDVYSSISETVNKSCLTMEDIKREWEELNELIDDGDLEIEEFESLFRKTGELLDQEAFLRLYQSIDDLFEDDIDSSDEVIPLEPSVKEDLLNYLNDIHTLDSAKLPCGFDCTENERKVVQEMITALESSTANLVVINQGRIEEKQVMGEWNLLYTSSRTMTINKSLSGLGRSSSNMAKFEGLRKRLAGTKYLGKAEYVETFGGEEASFDVLVTGEWMLEGRRNILTGMPSTSIRVDPEKLMYGPTTNNADEWASLGPIKLLDILYLDDNLMLLRGNSNIDSLFVYQRVDK